MPTFKYVPHYSDTTAIKKGTKPSRTEIQAREDILNEIMVDAKLDGYHPSVGHTVIYSSYKDLDQTTQDLLCVKKISP
jgi:hypothetical protein